MKTSLISLLLTVVISFSNLPYIALSVDSVNELTQENQTMSTINETNLDQMLSSSIHYSDIVGAKSRSTLVNTEYLEGYIFTPNGTDVALTFSSIYYLLELNLYPNKNVIRSENSLSEQKIVAMENRIANMGFVGIELLSVADSSYNCHSYAWYSQDVNSNNIWISFPYDYYSDGSYMEIDSPRVGDIVVYFDTDVILDRKQAIHSGIVVGFSGETANNNCEDANTIIVESKWGAYGLYRHKGDECPYTENYDGVADEVRYYRPRTTFSFDLNSTAPDASVNESILPENGIAETYTMYELVVEEAGYYDFTITTDYASNIKWFDSNMHQINYGVYEENNYVYLYIVNLPIGIYYLRTEFTNNEYSGDVNTSIECHEEHTYHCTSINTTHHISKCACGATSGSSSEHTYRSAGVDDLGNSYLECTACGFVKKVLGTDPFIPIIKTKFEDGTSE